MKNYVEAETWVIGGILLNPSENFDRARKWVGVNDFLNPTHKKIFSVVEEVNDEADMPLDFSVISSFLKKDEVEAARYLKDDIPTLETFDYWVRVVAEGSRKRELRQVTSNEDFDVVRASGIFEELRNLSKPDTLLYGPLDQIPPFSEDPALRMKIGFIDVDRYVPFCPGHLMIVSGKTGLGKTSFGLQVAHHVSKERPVGIISIEMMGGEIRSHLENSFGGLSKNIFVSDPPALSTIEFKQICKAMKSERGVQLILLDYLQLMREREDFRSRHLEVSYVIRRIKEIAKELNLAMIVISQLSRAVNYRGENSLPTLSDLKESGDVEYAADEILFIHQPQEGDDDYRGEHVKLLIVGKNRWGPTGQVKVFWDGEHTRFGNFREDGDDDAR